MSKQLRKKEKNTLKLTDNYSANVNSFIYCASFFCTILINLEIEPKA